MSSVTEITNVNEQTAFINGHDSCVIFFGSIRCHHCRDMNDVVADMAMTYPKVAFAHVEVTKVKVANVDGVPVFVGYRKQTPVDVVVGADPEALIQLVSSL